jgi:outer membrane protein OmpA-like peptidoglycan-associated protein
MDNETNGARPPPKVRTMTKPTRPIAGAARTLLVCIAAAVALPAAGADAPAVLDSASIVRSLSAPQVSTRGFVVEERPGTPAATAAAPGGGKVNLDIRFGNDSNRLSPEATTQLAQLGAALNAPALAHTRFLIAGHTSATGDAKHNQALSEGRARTVRTYLVDHYGVDARRLEAAGFGASRPRPQYPGSALQQRRVEVSALPGNP